MQDQVLTSGAFKGWSVLQIFTLADSILGGCSTAYSPSTIEVVLDIINQNYDDGTGDNGNLTCGGGNRSHIPPGGCCAGGSATVTFTVSDLCGNTATTSATLVVVDRTPPIAICKNDTVTLVNGQATITPVDVDGGSSDACSTISLAINNSVFDCTNIGNNTVILTVMDACNNTSSCAANVFVIGPPPVAVCKTDTVRLTSVVDVECIHPSDVDGGSSASACGFSLSLSDSCFSCANVGYDTVTLFVTDNLGNVDSCHAVVVVLPPPPTTPLCPPDMNLTLDCGIATISPNALAPPLCGSRIVPSRDTFYCADAALGGKVNVVKVYITNPFGGLDSCTFNVTVFPDVVTISAPGNDTTVQCNTVNSDHMPFSPPHVLESCYSIDSFQTSAQGTCPESRSVTRHWYATDTCGVHSDTVQQTIHIVDTIAPKLSGQGVNATIQCTQTPVFTSPTASDNCDANPIIDSFDTHGGTHCDSTFTRHWYAVDACGNISDTVTQTITVIDNTPPTIGGQGDDTTLTCLDCINGVPGFKAPTASDNCDPNPTIHSTRDSIPGACAQSYTIVMKWWAKDACGNVSDTVSQSINVIDNTPPTIFGQGPDTTVSCSSVIPFINPSAHDVCDLNPTIDSMQIRIPGNCPQSYTLITKWWAIDHCGNISDTVSQTINVIDTTAPVLSGQGANQFVSCPSCHVCVPGFTAPSAHDVCDLNPRITFKDDTTAGKCTAAYSITRTWTAKDACGNVSKPVSQTITVTDTIKPTVSGQGKTATIQCTKAPVFTAPTASDNCDANPMLDSTTSRVPGSCPAAYSVTRCWWAIDACGNVSDTVCQTINVIDTAAPVITVPAKNDTVQCNSSQSGINAWLASNGGAVATDACDTITWTNNFTPIVNNCDPNGGNKPVTAPGSDTCVGFRTETMGGWGAPPHGGNPGAFVHTYFATGFPGGLTVGCTGGFTLHFDSAQNITNFLPSGGTPRALSGSQVDPTGLGNTLAGQEVALALAIGFDNTIPGFSSNPSVHLQDLVVTSGAFQGWTVLHVFTLADSILGGMFYGMLVLRRLPIY